MAAQAAGTTKKTFSGASNIIVRGGIVSFNLRHTRLSHPLDRNPPTIRMATATTSQGRHSSPQKSGFPDKLWAPYITRAIMIYLVMKL